MNCGQTERRIYLYEELTPKERDETDRHVATCSKCQKTMERVNQERAVLIKMRGLTAPVPDHANITRRIMSRVLETQGAKPGVFHSFYAFYLKLSVTPLRYAMAILSLLLMVTFASEFSLGEGSQTITKPYRRNGQPHIQLNTASFYKTLTEKDHTASTNQPVYACLVGCLNAAHADCADCGKKFQNLIR